ncbi:hypothetical protein Pa4123_11300 [Phytohabitans aurantiacus]|uniref:Uncharacterized protein n=1 Tax=Phytohabitans aurantiacus TaxID=3016789 RepID=A0ABQ5QMC7_9ACTN|nr:hypothetical protein Pa4123_11300 [Phytohabitans aurantiacus]
MSCLIATTRPPIRLRPVPALDPPFEDEIGHEPWHAQLALQFDITGRQRAARPPVLVPGTGAAAAAASALDTAATETPVPVASATPEARQATKRFLDMSLEILNGYRPTGHIRSLTVPGCAEAVIAQFAAGLDKAAALRGGQPPHVTKRPSAFVRARRLHICEPCPGVVEAAAALGLAGRTWAMAFRLERRRGTWLCTAVRTV